MEPGHIEAPRIDQIEADAKRRADKIDAQDQGELSRGRKATDRGAYLRFNEAVKEARLSKILKADLTADNFSRDLDEAALARQVLFLGLKAWVALESLLNFAFPVLKSVCPGAFGDKCC